MDDAGLQPVKLPEKGSVAALRPRSLRSLVKITTSPPEGQTSARLARIVQRVKRDHMDENVLIVGHGGSLRAGIVSLLDLPLEANWKFAMHNCSLTVIHAYPDNAVMHLYNDTSHISGVVRAWDR